MAYSNHVRLAGRGLYSGITNLELLVPFQETPYGVMLQQKDQKLPNSASVVIDLLRHHLSLRNAAMQAYCAVVIMEDG